MTEFDIIDRLDSVGGMHTTLCAEAADRISDLRHQLQDMERERDVSRGNAQMHMEAARDLAMQLEAAQADAERWRFVRDHATVSVDEYVWITTSSGHRIHVTSACAGAEAEQLIDASIVIHKARGTK